MKIKILATAVIMLVAGGAWAFDPSGSYSFKEKGMSGSMEVKETTNIRGESVISVKLDTMNRQTNMCEFEANVERVISSDKSIDTLFVAPKDDYHDEDKIEIVFTPRGATINTSNRGAGFCGLNAYFDGKWVKDVPKRKAGKK